jgi:hypothetical protein
MKKFLASRVITAKGDRQMSRLKTTLVFSAVLSVAVVLGASLLAPPSAFAQAPSQRTFSSPDDALQALVTAAMAKDRSALIRLFGPDYDQLLSGDDVEDAKDLDEFAVAVGESADLQKVGDSEYTVTVGKNNWPTPIPLVQDHGKWFFDTKAGMDEVMNRRVGENEFSAITTCRAYAVARGSITPKATGTRMASLNTRRNSSALPELIMACIGKPPKRPNPARLEN